MAAKFLIVGLNAGTGILTARVLHPQGRGELAAILLWPQLLSGAVTLGLPSAMTYYIRSDPGRKQVFLWAGCVLGFVIGTIATCLGIFLAPTLLRQYSSAVVMLARWLMPNLMVGIYLLIGRAALEADREFFQSGLVLTGPPLLTLLGLVALALGHQLNSLTAAVTYTVSGLPACCYVYYRLRFDVHHTLEATVDAGKRLLSYGLRSYGIDLCGTLGYYLDQALVVGMLAPGSMGVYVVALSASRVMNVPQQALAAVLFPSMVGRSLDQIEKLVKLAVRVGGSLALVTSLATFIGGRFLLRVVYGSSFATVGGVLGILTAEAALSGCVTIVAQAFMAADRPGVITTQQFVGLAVTAPCLIILIPRFGISGAAASILLSTIVRCAFAMFSFKKDFGGKLPSPIMNRESTMWAWEKIRHSLPKRSLTGELA